MIYMGTKELKNLYRGSTAMKAVYSGTRKIWPSRKPAAGEKVEFAGRDWWICNADYTTNEIFLLMVNASAEKTAWASTNQGTNHWTYPNTLLFTRDKTLSDALSSTQKGFLIEHDVPHEYSDMKVTSSDNLNAMINALKPNPTTAWTKRYIFTLSLKEFRDYVNGKEWAVMPATSAVWPRVWYLHTGFTCYSARDNNREVYIDASGAAGGGYAYCYVTYGNDRQGCIANWATTGHDHWVWNDSLNKWILA